MTPEGRQGDHVGVFKARRTPLHFIRAATYRRPASYTATFADRRSRDSSRRAISPNISVCVGCGWIAFAT